MGSWTAGYLESDWLWLANPAPGWMGIDQLLWPGEFDSLGDFSAVWFPA